MRLLALLLLLTPSVAVGSLADTVGWTGGCTCVVVHPDGWALTAEHCPGVTEVEIAGRTVRARELHDPEKNGIDEVVLMKLDGGPFAFAPVASQPIRRGETVHSWGFPAGVLTHIGGTVNMVDADGHITGAFAAHGGHSGGPLFNAAGEVCGILSTSNRRDVSGWIGLPSIQRAMQYAQVSPRGGAPKKGRLVWVLTSPGCLPCENLKADYQRGQFPGITMRFVDGQSADGQRVLDRIEQVTGKRPRNAPTLWADGANTFTVGYSGVGTLRSWLITALRLPLTFWETITGDREREPVPGEPLPPEGEWQPVPQSEPPPPNDAPLQPIADSEPEPDFTGARLLLFAPAKLSSDTAANALLSLTRAATSQVREATDGKAEAVIISERQNPERYAAACAATSVTPGEFAGIVMVPAQSHGLRATIRGKLMAVVRDRLPKAVRDAPVGLLTEVASPKEYAATIAALAIQPAEPAQDPVEGGDPVSDSPITLALAALLGAIRRLFGGKP